MNTINRRLDPTRRIKGKINGTTIHPRLQQARKPMVLLIALILTLINTGGRYVVANSTAVPQTPTAPMLSGTFQVVNNGPGDQTNPDVDCNLISYASDNLQGSSLIHFISASTNTDLLVPGNGLDFLPRAGGNRITFTELNPLGDGVAVYDTMAQIRIDIPGVKRSHSAVGGDLVAFEDRSYFTSPNQSELGVYDLSTGTDIRLTNDTLFDKTPSVSPTGNAVVWEKCQPDGFGCDIYSATEDSPDVFTTRQLTGSAGEDRYPDTNGQIVVYLSDRTGENDIYYQPLTGGTETRIAIPGDQRDLSISGNLIAFESSAQLGDPYDIYVYDLSTKILYQVTNTAVDEVSSRIAFCNGTGRIVYDTPATDYDVNLFTFQLSNPVTQINNLIALVRSFSLPSALESSLISKLQDALTALSAGNTATACSALTSFIKQVQTQSGKKITTQQATQLISSANAIKSNLGCP